MSSGIHTDRPSVCATLAATCRPSSCTCTSEAAPKPAFPPASRRTILHGDCPRDEHRDRAHHNRTIERLARVTRECQGVRRIRDDRCRFPPATRRTSSMPIRSFNCLVVLCCRDHRQLQDPMRPMLIITRECPSSKRISTRDITRWAPQPVAPRAEPRPTPCVPVVPTPPTHPSRRCPGHAPARARSVESHRRRGELPTRPGP